MFFFKSSSEFVSMYCGTLVPNTTNSMIVTTTKVSNAIVVLPTSIGRCLPCFF